MSSIKNERIVLCLYKVYVRLRTLYYENPKDDVVHMKQNYLTEIT